MLMNAPAAYAEWIGKDLQTQFSLTKPDLVHVFAANKKEFENAMKKLKKLYTANTSLVIWVSWYKKSSGIPTDITEDDIRNYALANGLVDVKVCAVSENWSGLKLVVPLAKRK